VPDTRARLTLVQRRDCQLCEEMLVELQALARRLPLPPLNLVDVDADPQLRRRHGLDVPVLLLDGLVVCRHRLDADELRRLLTARRGLPPESGAGAS
jgi:predicted thioredoxin/glutaredoxin